MSDPKETLRDARARLRPILGRLLARRDEAQQTLDRTLAERDRVVAEAKAMREAGRAELADALAATALELDERATLEREAVALAERHFEEAKADEATLRADEDDVDHRRVRAAMDAAGAAPGDALSLDPTDVALRNVRDRARELEGITALPEDARKIDAPRSDPQADARAELARLKAERDAKKRTL